MADGPRGPLERAWHADATGNRFLLLDGLSGPIQGDWPELARQACEGATPALDGLLLCLPPRDTSAQARMVLYNADGSRPEACGNGLRCVTELAGRLLHLEGTFSVETDSGVRPVRRTSGGPPSVSLGVARVVDPACCVSLSATDRVTGCTVDVGNPHLVLFDQPLDLVQEWGPKLEVHPAFPDRTNVEFAMREGDELVVRVWERGVGETGACGTGAVAVFLAARSRGLWGGDRARVRLPGGVLEVELSEGQSWLTGEVALSSLRGNDHERLAATVRLHT